MLWFYEFSFPVLWVAFLVYWRIKAADTKSTQRLEPVASRILRALTLLMAIILFATTRIPLRWLYLQLWPAGLWPSGWELPSWSLAYSSPFGRVSIWVATGARPSRLRRAMS